MSAGELTVNLQRDGCGEPFGFRLRGGTDIREAFIIQRVKFPYFPISILIFNTIRLKSPKIIEKMWQILWVLISYFKEMAWVAKRKRERERTISWLFFFCQLPHKVVRGFCSFTTCARQNETGVFCRVSVVLSLSFSFWHRSSGLKLNIRLGEAPSRVQYDMAYRPSVVMLTSFYKLAQFYFFCFSRFFLLVNILLATSPVFYTISGRWKTEGPPSCHSV